VVLGKFLANFLGDVICTSMLPRQLTQHFGSDVWVAAGLTHRAVFDNNPYVRGIAEEGGIDLTGKLNGFGHTIQRLQQGFGLSIDAVPRPELYLSEQEKTWAQEQRAQWPQGKPVCLLCTQVRSEGRQMRSTKWSKVCALLARDCTVIQPVLVRGRRRYEGQFTIGASPAVRQEVPIASGAVVYENLPKRLYLTLFSVADVFCGGPSSGSHAAAAFDLPSMIVLYQKLKDKGQFPNPGHWIAPEAFLYPQHEIVAGESFAVGHSGWKVLEHHWKRVWERFTLKKKGIRENLDIGAVALQSVRSSVVASSSGRFYRLRTAGRSVPKTESIG
jgi:ADP-heptose:LPS heptosyltransferase